MKKFLIILGLVGMLMVPVVASAQDSTQTTQSDFFALAGAQYDSDFGTGVRAGVASRLGGPLVGILLGEFGQSTSSIGVDLGMMFPVPGTERKMYVGLLAGPYADWLTVPADSTEIVTQEVILNYIVGAAGGFLHYDLSDRVGLAGGGKYKFALEDGTAYPDGWTFGGFFTYRFGK